MIYGSAKANLGTTVRVNPASASVNLGASGSFGHGTSLPFSMTSHTREALLWLLCVYKEVSALNEEKDGTYGMAIAWTPTLKRAA